MKQNKNRLELRLDPESLELLNSLLVRTNLTKTSLIKIALKVYASTLKKGHIYTVKLKAEDKIISEEPKIEVPAETNFNLDEELKKLDEEYPYKY